MKLMSHFPLCWTISKIFKDPKLHSHFVLVQLCKSLKNLLVLIYSKLHLKSCACLYKFWYSTVVTAIWCLNWQVERPRIEKKPVTSEHPVIKRKKKKYKDPDNLCKMPVHDLTALNFACIFILLQINVDCGMFNSFTVEISPEHADTEWYEGEWSLQFLAPLKHLWVSPFRPEFFLRYKPLLVK